MRSPIVTSIVHESNDCPPTPGRNIQFDSLNQNNDQVHSSRSQSHYSSQEALETSSNPPIPDMSSYSELLEAFKDLQRQVEDMKKNKKESKFEPEWIDTRETEVSFQGDRVVIGTTTYEYSRVDNLPDWICLEAIIDPKDTLTLSADRVVQTFNAIFDVQAVPKSKVGAKHVITTPLEHLVPLQRFFLELHKTYIPVFSARIGNIKSKSATESLIHKEFLPRNSQITVHPSDMFGSMSAEVYYEWAKDEIMNMEKVQEKLGLSFALSVHKDDLEQERKARMEVVRLHNIAAQVSQAGQAFPEMFVLCQAVLNSFAPFIYQQTKAWYDCKYYCRQIALQYSKLPASLKLLRSNPWTDLLFDFESADIPETDSLKTWGWNKILAVNEDVAKAVSKNPKCIDSEKERIIVPKQKQNFQPFRASTSASRQFHAGKFNKDQFKSKSYKHSSHQYKPYSQRDSNYSGRNYSYNYQKNNQFSKGKSSSNSQVKNSKSVSKAVPKDKQ